MGVPLRMKFKVGAYLVKQKLLGRQKYPLVMMLEPLFACNLECAGCGKIQYPAEILRKRLTPEQCWESVEECGAPVVTVAGGEPLIHPDIDKIVNGLIERKKFVYLCSNAILLEKNIHRFKPSPYLIFSIHLDGAEKTHDRMVCRGGIYDIATRAIKKAKSLGFNVMTNTTIFDGEDVEEFREFFEYATKELKVDGMMISPGYAYQKAPRQDIFLKHERTKDWFRQAISGWREKKWPFNHSSFYLDFLEGKKTYDCTPWGIPLRNVFGWQKPCYLMAEAGYAQTYKELLETTDWSKYGHASGNSKCANCMVHSGFEPSAVDDTFSHPIEALKSAMGWGKYKSSPANHSGPTSGGHSLNGMRLVPVETLTEKVPAETTKS